MGMARDGMYRRHACVDGVDRGREGAGVREGGNGRGGMGW